jgi:EAL domain-containing protein (putative c-di-GMP-specific phosphodiesterase class I)
MIQEQLRVAVEQGQITAVFQPQIEVSTRRIIAVEALARWQHPELGLITPDRFIPLAERGREIHDIGIQMFRHGLRLATEMRALGRPLEVSVNVSAAQLADRDFPDHAARLLSETDLPSGTITLEITESHAILDVAGVSDRLHDLHDLGVIVSIDDFGIGYSSMERVVELPVHEIKIDISMVQDESDAGYAAFLEIAEYAHAAGIRIVAEGVETEDQHRRVTALRCHRAQGWLYARPLDRDALIELTARGGTL